MLRFPPLTPAVRALLIALSSLFVLGAVLQNFLDVPIYYWLALSTRSLSPATLWQLITHVMVVPPDPGVLFSFALSLLFIWLILAPFEARYGQARVLQLTLVSAVSSAIPALLVGQFFPNFAGSLAGPHTITLAAIAGYAATLPPQAEMSFFGVLPMRAKHLMAIIVAFSVIGFLTTRNAAQLAADFGAIGGGVLFCKYWLHRTPSYKPRKGRGGPKLRAIPGGNDRDSNGDPKRWLN